MAKNHYETLGIAASAQMEPAAFLKMVKDAHRKLSLRYHPDAVQRQQGYITPEQTEAAEEKQKELNYAYDILSDENKRRQYDRSLLRTSPIEGHNYQPPQAQPRYEYYASAAPPASNNATSPRENLKNFIVETLWNYSPSEDKFVNAVIAVLGDTFGLDNKRWNVKTGEKRAEIIHMITCMYEEAETLMVRRDDAKVNRAFNTSLDVLCTHVTVDNKNVSASDPYNSEIIMIDHLLRSNLANQLSKQQSAGFQR